MNTLDTHELIRPSWSIRVCIWRSGKEVIVHIVITQLVYSTYGTDRGRGASLGRASGE